MLVSVDLQAYHNPVEKALQAINDQLRQTISSAVTNGRETRICNHNSNIRLRVISSTCSQTFLI